MVQFDTASGTTCSSPSTGILDWWLQLVRVTQDFCRPQRPVWIAQNSPSARSAKPTAHDCHQLAQVNRDHSHGVGGFSLPLDVAATGTDAKAQLEFGVRHDAARTAVDQIHPLDLQKLRQRHSDQCPSRLAPSPCRTGGPRAVIAPAHHARTARTVSNKKRIPFSKLPP